MPLAYWQAPTAYYLMQGVFEIQIRKIVVLYYLLCIQFGRLFTIIKTNNIFAFTIVRKYYLPPLFFGHLLKNCRYNKWKYIDQLEHLVPQQNVSFS